MSATPRKGRGDAVRESHGLPAPESSGAAADSFEVLKRKVERFDAPSSGSSSKSGDVSGDESRLFERLVELPPARERDIRGQRHWVLRGLRCAAGDCGPRRVGGRRNWFAVKTHGSFPKWLSSAIAGRWAVSSVSGSFRASSRKGTERPTSLESAERKRQRRAPKNIPLLVNFSTRVANGLRSTSRTLMARVSSGRGLLLGGTCSTGTRSRSGKTRTKIIIKQETGS